MRATTQPRSSLARGLLVAAGSLSLGLAVVGIVVPLLPTTPLLLLAAACYLRGSERLHRWLLSHPQMGPYLRNFQQGRGIPLRAKIAAVTLLWATIGYAVLFVVSAIALRALLLAVATAVTLYLVTRPTLRPGR